MIKYTAQQHYDVLVAVVQDIMNRSEVEIDEEMDNLLWLFNEELCSALGLPSPNLPVEPVHTTA